MVGVHIHIETADLDHGYLHRSLLCLQPDNLPWLQCLGIAEMLGCNALDIGWFTLTIGFIGFDGNLKGIACSFSRHGFFQTFDDISGAVQIGHRITLAGSFQLFTLGIFKGVVKSDNRMFADVHAGWDRQ